jgi:DNA-binding protein YbaB
MQAELGSILDEYRSMQARAERVAAELARLRETARSADRSVTATVSTQGELVGLSLEPTIARRLSFADLADRVLEASALATARIRERVHGEMLAVLPENLRHLVRPDGTIDVSEFLPVELTPDQQGHSRS